MASITGGVRITGFISPTDTLDTYAVIDPIYGIDGIRNVDTISDRDSITSERRRQGMIVGVKNGATNDYYILNSGNTTWTQIQIVTGLTWNTGTYDLTLNTFGGGITRNLGILATDMTVTGGTYDSNNGTVSFTNNSGGTFQVSGFTSGYTNIYTSAATYSQPNGEISLTFTDPSKNLTITGITSIYGKDDSLKSNRLVDLNDKTLNFSSSTAPNTLTITTGGTVGIGVLSADSALHISAATNPVEIDGLSSVSGSSRIIGINPNNKLHVFTGSTNSVAYFLNGNMVASPWLTFASGGTNTLNIGNGDSSPFNGATLNFAGGRASLNFPASAGGSLTLQVGATNPFDASKGILLKNGATKQYLLFDSEGGSPGAGNAFVSGHTATFGTTIIVNTSVDGLGYGTSFWGVNGIATRVVGNTYIDTTTATTTASEIVASSFGVPTFSSFTGRTYSALTNVYIAGAPVAGTNVSTLNSYALNVNAGTTYLGGNLILSGISSGTTTQLLTREANGNISFRNSADVAGNIVGTSGGTLYWYAEPSTPPTTAPLVTGVASIALGNNAQATSTSMFVIGSSAGNSATNVTNSNFIGNEAGRDASGATNSNFIGQQAGSGATSAISSNFFGNTSGYQAQSAQFSNFMGGGSGYQATGASNSNFFGQNAGSGATNASGSNFLGNNAGNFARNSTFSNFFGSTAGFQASGVTHSNFIGFEAGYQALNTSGSTFIGESAGIRASGTTFSFFVGRNAGFEASGNTDCIFIGDSAGSRAPNRSDCVFIGREAGFRHANNSSVMIGARAGYQATGATSSVMIGNQAGNMTTLSTQSLSNAVFIGTSAGNNASGASQSTFVGQGAGQGARVASGAFFGGAGAGNGATNAAGSIIIGFNAGQGASGSSQSVFIGNQAGDTARNAQQSVMVGSGAGFSALTASQSVMIGYRAGNLATGATDSIFIGTDAGYTLSATGTTGSGNIVIGNAITVPPAVTNRINIGGVIFGVNAYPGGSMSTAATATGAVSIGTPVPDTSAILDLTSTSRGFLPPRMTGTQAAAISSKAEGLLVYVTDTTGGFASKGWWGWNGASWTQLG